MVNLCEYESDLRINEHYLSNSQKKDWKKQKYFFQPFFWLLLK